MLVPSMSLNRSNSPSPVGSTSTATTLRGQSATLRRILIRFGRGRYSKDISRVGVTAIITVGGKPRAPLARLPDQPRMPTARTGCPGVTLCAADLHMSRYCSIDVFIATPTSICPAEIVLHCLGGAQSSRYSKPLRTRSWRSDWRGDRGATRRSRIGPAASLDGAVHTLLGGRGHGCRFRDRLVEVGDERGDLALVDGVH